MRRGSRIFQHAAICLAVCLALCGCGQARREAVKAPDDKYRTFYEVFVRSYCDGDGDGIGDLQGLTQKLDYIEDMGFNGIWLMPVFSSTTYHKYDVTDYYTIDSEYGTLEDFRALLAECGERGIRVILDLPFNHTSSEHAWFKEACAYLATLAEGEEPDAGVCPYVDYYHFSREYHAGYSEVSGTDWYYESVFWYGMPDLNLYSEAVRGEIEAVAAYWMDMGVYGFRLDGVKEYESGATSRNVEILSWFVSYMKENYPDSYLVGEVWDTQETIAAYYASGIDSLFDFPFGDHDGRVVSAIKNAGNGTSGASFARSLQEQEALFRAQNPEMIDAPFLSNHDVGRTAGFLAPSEDRVKLGGALNLLMSGASFVYYGEEIGMKGAGKDENKRAPMLWAAEGSEGMTNPPPGMEQIQQKYGTLEEQQANEDSINAYYREAIRIRNTYPEIARGTQTAVELADGDLIVIAKTYEGAVTYVMVNNSEETKTVELAGTPLEGTKLADTLVTMPSTQDITLKGDTLTLPAYGICILK